MAFLKTFSLFGSAWKGVPTRGFAASHRLIRVCREEAQIAPLAFGDVSLL